MFDNIGGKLKTLASAVMIIGCIASVILGLLNVVNLLILTPLGCLISWIAALPLYGIGQAVENSEKILSRLPAEEESSVSQEATQTPAVSPVPKNTPWVCFSCGTNNLANHAYCAKCNVSRGWSDRKHEKAKKEKE